MAAFAYQAWFERFQRGSVFIGNDPPYASLLAL